MKALGIILTGFGVILSFFTFLFYTLEDYTPYADPVPSVGPYSWAWQWALSGLVCLKKVSLNTGQTHRPAQLFCIASVYNFQPRKMEINRENPITPASTNPASPISGISCHLGGMPDNTTRDEPTIKAARTMAKTNLLLVRLWVLSKGSRPECPNSILIFPSLACLRMDRTSPGISRPKWISSVPILQHVPGNPPGIKAILLNLPHKRLRLLQDVKRRIQHLGNALDGAQGFHHQVEIGFDGKPMGGNRLNELLEQFTHLQFFSMPINLLLQKIHEISFQLFPVRFRIIEREASTRTR